jgi:phenylacetate-CoA ligase
MRPQFFIKKIQNIIEDYKIRSYKRKKLTQISRMHNSQTKSTQSSKKQLKTILKYAYYNCPYYNKLFNDLNFQLQSLENFEKIPLLNKRIIRNNEKELISKNIHNINFYEMNTGGSTGTPLKFIVSNKAGFMDSIHQEFLFRFMGYKDNDLIVTFDGTSVPEKDRENNIFWFKKSESQLPYGSLRFSTLYLSPKNIQYYVNHLIKIKPKFLRGYPSSISKIANFIINNNIQINLNIKGVMLTSEEISKEQIYLIKNVFKTKVFLQYGHSEACVFGYTFDDTYEYICSPFYGYTEIVNEKGNHVKEGEIGEIVVTGFYNKAQPFIRYQTGDLALFKNKKNGLVKLKKIIGRKQDFVISKNGNKKFLTGLMFGQHFKSFANIKEWQIEQNIPGKITVRVEKTENFNKEDTIEINNKLKDILNVEVEITLVDSVKKTKRGKKLFLIQNVKS